MYVRVNLHGYGSVYELLLGYTREETSLYLAVRDSYRAGRAAARADKPTTPQGAATNGFLAGLQSVSAIIPRPVIQAGRSEPDTRRFASAADVRTARREMRNERDARLGRQ
jgi:hypothetical protein